MKRTNVFKLLVTLVTVLSLSMTATAQDSTATDDESFIDAGLDLYTSYIWRGSKFGSGPAFQPWVETTFGDLAIGAWGSANASTDEAFEMDMYIGYSFDFGLGITVTDYYFGGSWLSDSVHYIEPSLSYEYGDFSFLGGYMFTPDFEDGDIYLEVGYSLGDMSIALGAGDGAYTDDGDFMLCNLAIGTEKEIEITEKFSLPLSGTVMLNPSTGGFFIAAGLSF